MIILKRLWIMKKTLGITLIILLIFATDIPTKAEENCDYIKLIKSDG